MLPLLFLRRIIKHSLNRLNEILNLAESVFYVVVTQPAFIEVYMQSCDPSKKLPDS